LIQGGSEIGLVSPVCKTPPEPLLHSMSHNMLYKVSLHHKTNTFPHQ
jgi:hypothetical protein